MSCTRTVWLIDTENIPKKWVKTVYFKTKRDKLIIFLGPEATCMSLKELQVFLTKYPANQVEFCNSNAGKNSMDFHIAAKLGSLCTTGKKSHYIIVSGDKGYDGLMDDIQAPPIGTLGTVSGIDDTGSIMVRWDNGSGLFVVYGEDVVKKVP